MCFFWSHPSSKSMTLPLVEKKLKKSKMIFASQNKFCHVSSDTFQIDPFNTPSDDDLRWENSPQLKLKKKIVCCKRRHYPILIPGFLFLFSFFSEIFPYFFTIPLVIKFYLTFPPLSLRLKLYICHSTPTKCIQ